MGACWRSREDQGSPMEVQPTYVRAADAGENARQARRPLDGMNAALLRGRTFSGQQQRQQAQLCSRLLGALAHLSVVQQQEQQHQRPSASLSSLSRRVGLCAENGDARGATAAVISFLKDFGVVIGAAAAVQRHQEHTRAAAEAARAGVSAIADYCRANTAANAAELLVQRQLITCVALVFRFFPQLGAPDSAALRQALGVACAAAVTLHRALGAEPRPKTDRCLQRHLQQQQQQQQILAVGLTATQPKQAALMRALLLSLHSLLAELARARSAAAAGRGHFTAASEDATASAMAPPGTVGEVTVELLLLLLPLTLAQPCVSMQLPLQLRNISAPAGWTAPCELTTDFASTQESDPDTNPGGSFRRRAPRISASLSWRRSSQEGPSRVPTPHTPRSETTPAPDNPEVRGHPVRAECLRCVEGLLRLCGRELFPYWSLLLQYRGPRMLPLAHSQWSFVSSMVPPGITSSTLNFRGPRQERRQSALDEWLCELVGIQQQDQQELPWACLATAAGNAKVSRQTILVSWAFGSLARCFANGQ